MSLNIVRLHLDSGTKIIVANRAMAEDATDLVAVLNKHAVGYQFLAEVA